MAPMVPCGHKLALLVTMRFDASVNGQHPPPWRTAMTFVVMFVVVVVAGAAPAIPASLQLVSTHNASDWSALWQRIVARPRMTLVEHETQLANATTIEAVPADDVSIAVDEDDASPEQRMADNVDVALLAPSPALGIDRSQALQRLPAKLARQRDRLQRKCDGLGCKAVEVESVSSLSSFFGTLDALATEANNVDPARAGVVVFGNSLIASDHVIDVMRARLQGTFGDGGRGLLLPDRLSKVAGRRVRTGTGSSNWDIHALFSEAGTAVAPPLGMTGSAHEASSDGATITWTIDGESEATLYWRSGAPFSLWQGNTLLAQADADLDAQGRARTLSLRGNTALHLKASKGTQLYGVAVERKTAGVVVDTIGVPAASARLYREGVDEDLFAAQLSSRSPALVVAMIGGNEARGIAYGKLTADAFEQTLTRFLQRIRTVAPRADCLVVTPIDAVKANATGDVLSSRPELITIVDIQRRVAQQQGCALLDLFAAMGGAGSLVRFRDAGLISDDLVHPTGAGGDVLGHLLADSLLQSYGRSQPSEAAIVHRRSEQRQGPLPPPSTLLALSFPTVEKDGVVQLNGHATAVATRPRALTQFYRRLRSLEDGDDEVRRVAIGQFGASHTAGQSLTDRMRERLVERFGSAGRGLVAAGPNNNRLLPSGVVRSIEGSFHVADGREVLTGGTVGMTGTKTRLGPGAVFRVGFRVGSCNGCELEPRPAKVQLSWFYTPDMGTADVVVDGAVVASLDASGRRTESDVQFMNLEVEDERSIIEVRNHAEAKADVKTDKNAKPTAALTSKSGPVHLLSVSSETEGRGVVLDAMGLPGTTGMTPQRWRQDLLTEEVKARDYDLVITAWGTNEAGISRLDEQTYRHHFGNTLKTLVSSSGADCLIIGASDRLDLVGESWQPATNHAMVERVQRSLAAEHGCAFFSLRTAMGGPGSMKQWVANKQALPDHVHFTRDGYRMLGDLIIDDLFQDYADWKLTTLEAMPAAGSNHAVP